MQIHKLTIVFDGARAALGRLDAADVPEITLGARRLLTASALFYTEGLVPRDTDTSSAYFDIEGGSPGGEPWMYDTWIRIVGSEVYDTTTYTFTDHFVALLQAWERGSSFRPPEFARSQGPGAGRLYSSIWDSEPPLRTQSLRLSERLAQAMEMITRPSSRSASSLRLVLDATPVLTVGRRSLEAELDAYSRKMKDRASAKVG